MTGYGNGRTERAALLGQITQVSFALDDLRLFLDTHPECREAGAMYAEYGARREELMNTYAAGYGALDAYKAGRTGDGAWVWNDTPMPWESEAN